MPATLDDAAVRLVWQRIQRCRARTHVTPTECVNVADETNWILSDLTFSVFWLGLYM